MAVPVRSMPAAGSQMSAKSWRSVPGMVQKGTSRAQRGTGTRGRRIDRRCWSIRRSASGSIRCFQSGPNARS
jgi:hypothetical protein